MVVGGESCRDGSVWQDLRIRKYVETDPYFSRVGIGFDESD